MDRPSDDINTGSTILSGKIILRSARIRMTKIFHVSNYFSARD